MSDINSNTELDLNTDRFIQETIEGTVANLILKGEATSGKTITFLVNNNSLEAKIS